MATQEPGTNERDIRFVVIDMPPISEDYLAKLLRSEFPDLSPAWNTQFCRIFQELQKNAKVQKFPRRHWISVDCSASVRLIKKGLAPLEALRLGIGNKIFDPYERKLVDDLFLIRVSEKQSAAELFQ